MKTNILTMIEQAEVEWKPLGEVAKIQRGASPRPISQYLTDDKEGIPWIKIGDVAVGAKYVEQTEQRITYEGSLKSRVLKKGDFIMSNSMSYGRPYILNIDGAIHDGWASISEFQDKINSDFLYYYLSSDIVQSYWTGKINSGSVSNLNSDIIKSLLIPIPPLELQKEIVKRLDILTELEATLEAELSLRKKQYQYYRDFLLSETELAKVGFEWKKIEDIFEILAGGDVPKDALSKIKTSEYSIPILSNGIEEKALYGWTNQAKISKPSLTISARGTIGWTSYRDEPFFPIVRLLVLTPKIELNLKYAFYFMKMIENDYKVPESGIPQLTKPMIKDITIPIPPLETQAQIVKILDKFDRLTSSITDGLPKEIELRRKQYEYYRELLLGFSKPE